MNRDFGKIFSIVLLTIITVMIAYLSLITYGKKGNEEIAMVKIYGSNLLSEDIYMQYADLGHLSALDNLSLNVIKKRIEDHPYVAKAEVKSDGGGAVEVKITEKNMYVRLLNKNIPYFLTNEFELIKIEEYSNYSYVPEIINFRLYEKMIPSKKYKNEDIIAAFKVIDAAKIADVNLANRLTEINLNNGGEITLYLSGVDFPVLFGRGDEAKKIIYLSLIWERLNTLKAEYQNTKYIDLRFSNEAYIGSKEIQA